jgi:uncharacterized protein
MMTYLELAKEVLSQTQQALTPNEIWTRAVELGLDKSMEINGKTPWNTISARLYVDISENIETAFVIAHRRPTRFGLKNILSKKSQKEQTTQGKTDNGIINIEKQEDKEKSKSESFHERDLHPLLVKFADFHFRGAKLKTIYHEYSIRQTKGQNKWLHPDLVGVYFPFFDKVRAYDKVLIDLQKNLSSNSIKIFSFEMKKNLEMNNLREAYFQAVSNSSWANEGYLVCLELAKDEEVIEEIRRLNNSFGIGVIQLHSESIYESEIIAPARSKKDLDIDTMDRLAGDNRDFKEFLQNIIDDNTIKKVNSQYDKVLNESDFERYLKDKKIR